MQAGRLDRRINIQVNTPVPDALGEPVPSWANLAADVPAEVKHIAGEEIISGGRTGRRTASFKIRWRGDLTTDMRIVYDGQNYEVTDIKELGRHEGEEIIGLSILVE